MAVGVRRANRPYMQPIGVPVTASVLPPPPSPAASAVCGRPLTVALHGVLMQVEAAADSCTVVGELVVTV